MINFQLFDYHWIAKMANGRPIHKEYPWFYYADENVKCNNNEVHLTITKNPTTIYWEGTTYNPQFACGLIRSMESFGYGYFTSEIQLPKGKSLWPSFWLSGVGRWPDNGEIDICEAYCNKNGSYFRPLWPRWDTTNNIHYENNGHCMTGATGVSILKQSKNPSSCFIKYQCEWRPNQIIIRVNDKVINTYCWDVAKYLLDKRMNVIFNVFPSREKHSITTDMIIKSFEYKPL